jgi:hypothetical protein
MLFCASGMKKGNEKLHVSKLGWCFVMRVRRGCGVSRSRGGEVSFSSSYTKSVFYSKARAIPSMSGPFLFRKDQNIVSCSWEVYIHPQELSGLWWNGRCRVSTLSCEESMEDPSFTHVIPEYKRMQHSHFYAVTQAYNSLARMYLGICSISKILLYAEL